MWRRITASCGGSRKSARSSASIPSAFSPRCSTSGPPGPLSSRSRGRPHRVFEARDGGISSSCRAGSAEHTDRIGLPQPCPSEFPRDQPIRSRTSLSHVLRYACLFSVSRYGGCSVLAARPAVAEYLPARRELPVLRVVGLAFSVAHPHFHDR